MVDLAVVALMFAAGLATVLGAIPVVTTKDLDHRRHDTVLGFAAGIMLGISALDILPHGSQHASDPVVLALSILLGGILVATLVRAIHRIPLPMPFVKSTGNGTTSSALLLFLALAIHNAPEGLATGVGYSEGLTSLGHAVALGIAVQNIPEGLLVSVSIRAEGGSRRVAVGYAALSGLVEPAAGLVALLWLSVSPAHLGLVSGFAVGAMWSVVGLQMVPESHRHGHHVPATLALLGGLGVAVVLQVLLGFIAS